MPLTGRSWGKWNADALPIDRRHYRLPYDQGITLRRVYRKFTGIKPPVRHRRPTNMACYVKYPTTQKLLAWLMSNADFEPGNAGRERTDGSRSPWSSGAPLPKRLST